MSNPLVRRIGQPNIITRVPLTGAATDALDAARTELSIMDSRLRNITTELATERAKPPNERIVERVVEKIVEVPIETIVHLSPPQSLLDELAAERISLERAQRTLNDRTNTAITELHLRLLARESRLKQIREVASQRKLKLRAINATLAGWWPFIRKSKIRTLL